MTGRAGLDPRADEVLAFWFGAQTDDAAVLADRGSSWFTQDAAFDQSIRARFADLRDAATGDALDGWLEHPRGRLARVILVDQFSRNLFRGDPRAFEADPLALGWAREGVAAGAERVLRPVERVFLYLPFEHSESLLDQDRSVALFTALHDGVPDNLRAAFGTFLDFARRHREMIARFGRFPHRNAVLGRESTPAERAFLAQPGSRF